MGIMGDESLEWTHLWELWMDPKGKQKSELKNEWKKEWNEPAHKKGKSVLHLHAYPIPWTAVAQL